MHLCVHNRASVDSQANCPVLQPLSTGQAIGQRCVREPSIMLPFRNVSDEKQPVRTSTRQVSGSVIQLRCTTARLRQLDRSGRQYRHKLSFLDAVPSKLDVASGQGVNGVVPTHANRTISLHVKMLPSLADNDTTRPCFLTGKHSRGCQTTVWATAGMNSPAKQLYTQPLRV